MPNRFRVSSQPDAQVVEVLVSDNHQSSVICSKKAPRSSGL
jgi:hypothetical protein